MSLLEQTQKKFYQAIFDKKTSLDFIHSKNPENRLAIYRSNIFENLRNRIATIFPGIWILLGDDCANSAALAFVKNPDNKIKAFPDFLSEQAALAHLPYLKDYARYEWLLYKSLRAPCVQAINPNLLETIPEEKLARLRFVFLPSVFLYTAQFSLEQIKTIIDNPEASAINLKQERMTVLIAKPKKHVFTLFIKSDMGLFFTYLSQGKTLGETTEQISAQHPDFDLTQAMHILLKYKLIMEIR